MSLLLLCMCANFFYNIQANIDLHQIFQPVQQMFACTVGPSYKLLGKEFTFIGCATTCAALYGCYALNQRFVNPTALCALFLSGYVCYKYNADEEIKNLFVDATNFINAAIINTTQETHDRLHVIDEQTRKTNQALLLLEIKMRAQAMQERIEIRNRFNEIEQHIKQQSNEQYQSMCQKLIDLEHRFNYNLAQTEHNIQKHATQTTHKLLTQNKKEIIDTVQQQTVRMKNRQQGLLNEVHNVGRSTSLQSQEIGRCLNALMHQLELTNQTVANTQSMVHVLAQAVNVQVNSTSGQPFAQTNCNVPDYEPLKHSLSPQRSEQSDHKDDELELMVTQIKEQQEVTLVQQKKEIQQQYDDLQAQLVQEHTRAKEEFDTLLKKHKAQTAKQVKKARKEALAQEKLTQEQIDQEPAHIYVPISDAAAFTRKPSLVSSTLAYVSNVRSLVMAPLTPIMLFFQNLALLINDVDDERDINGDTQ